MADNAGLIRQEWADGLAGLSADQIGNGLAWCKTHLTWPPSVSEFLASCQQGDEHAGDAYRSIDPRKLLPQKPTEEQIAHGKENLRALKERLGMLSEGQP